MVAKESNEQKRRKKFKSILYTGSFINSIINRKVKIMNEKKTSQFESISHFDLSDDVVFFDNFVTTAAADWVRSAVYSAFECTWPINSSQSSHLFILFSLSFSSFFSV